MTPDRARAPIESALASLSSETLLGFLERQRWFGSKGARDAQARIDGAVVVPWGAGIFAVSRVVVSSPAGSRTYQVPLAAREATPAHVPDTAIVARVDTPTRSTTVYDAMHDAEFLDGLVHALRTGGVVASDTAGRLVVDHVAGANVDLPPDAAITLGAAEQSNTSLVVGDAAIFKLFRTLNAGIHPEIEVSAFLTRARFPDTPALLATLRFESNGESVVAGSLQQFLPGAVDAWGHALARGRSYFTAPANRDAPNAFLDDAKRLGAMTRALHESLASDDHDPDFAPEPALPEDLDRWAERARQMMHESLTLLEHRLSAPSFPRERAAEARALVGRRAHYDAWIDEIADRVGDDLGARVRTHGDYHLGQVLRARDGSFYVIDFEGEPTRPLSERREKTSPLRDVAGLLRSIAYAAATLAAKEGRAAPPHVRELRAARWERDVRAALLDGYFAPPDDEHLLPEESFNARMLIALFETEKAFYELAYELNNRPDWVGIPMRGVSKLLTK